MLLERFDNVINIYANILNCFSLQPTFVLPDEVPTDDAENIPDLADGEISTSERLSQEALITCEEV